MTDFQNFEEIETTHHQTPTKVVNGLTLVWSEPEKMYVLPVMEKANYRLLYNEETETFIQVLIQADFFYSDTQSTAPDGSKIRQRILIGRNRQGIPILLPDPETQKAVIQHKVLEMKKTYLDIFQSGAALVLVGVLVSIGFFFYYLIGECAVMASAFALGSAAAMAEMGFWAAVIGGLIIAGFVLKITLPLLFRTTVVGYEPDERATYDGSVNVNINQSTGSGNQTGGGAQSFINNRKL